MRRVERAKEGRTFHAARLSRSGILGRSDWARKNVVSSGEALEDTELSRFRAAGLTTGAEEHADNRSHERSPEIKRSQPCGEAVDEDDAGDVRGGSLIPAVPSIILDAIAARNLRPSFLPGPSGRDGW